VVELLPRAEEARGRDRGLVGSFNQFERNQ
jgi:hypothetical protein